ncbi:MAG: TetR/AcrR family transcriptional regulator [Lachnospiraceae bacterium]|nr:TetR/AcrR family transcriptional regulator [Lachnospiraceae bacterium]
MAGRKKNPEKTAATRNALLEKSYELFVSKNIEDVSMQEIARECGYGTMTLYRYYNTKPKLVVAVATHKWKQFSEENQKRRPSVNFEGMTSADIFEFYLESFIVLYRSNKDLLRFNQFFNVYIQSENVDEKDLQPYQGIIDILKERFHIIYSKAKEDNTIRTDEPEEEMFSITLHLMLAAVTRYAVGLVYIPEKGFDDERELEKMKQALLIMYKT